MPYDPAVPRWPDLLCPKDITDPQLINATMESPSPIVGAGQSVLSNAGLWQIKLIEIPVFQVYGGNDLLALWRSLFTMRLQQGLPVYMPFWDWKRGPVARGGLPLKPPPTLFDDGSRFSDGTSFDTAFGDVSLAANASIGATSITVDVQDLIERLGATPTAGDFISIEGRVYLIGGAWKDDTVARRWTWSILPQLRDDLVAGAWIEIRDPVCRMVLEPSDRKKAALTRDLGIIGRGTLSFIEDRW